MLPSFDVVDRDGMRAAGRFNAQLMDQIRMLVKPGVSTDSIDKFIYDYTLDHGHTPATLGYKGDSGVCPFPKSCCASVNEVVCHGIPDDYVLQDGDIVNFDLTTIVDGWHGDSSETFLIGEVDDDARRLVQCTLDCLYLGIAAARPLGSVRAIGVAITDRAEAAGFSVVRAFQGHGIGRKFHQDPGIPHFPGHPLSFVPLLPGMCFTIEPMLNIGVYDCEIDVFGDEWTARTRDGKLSAQFEHTILMTEDGPEILTLTHGGPQP